MNLEQYPRPDNDTGIGFHYSLLPSHLGVEAGRFWLPALESLGARWLVVRLTDSKIVASGLFSALGRAGIETVALLDPPEVGSLSRKAVSDAASACAKVGVRYMAVYDRPNCVDKWNTSEWFRPNPAQRLADCLFPCMQAVADKGLIPVLPALDPCGDYWDIGFLNEILRLLVSSRYSPLVESMALGIRNFAYNRPLGWGKGGKSVWTDTGPYYRPSGQQDHVGFSLFEWYDEIVEDVLGQHVPMVAIANGTVVGDDFDKDFPEVDERTHSIRSVEMARMLIEGELPDYVMNHAYWVLHGYSGDPKHQSDWFSDDGGELPAVSALKLMLKSPRPGLATNGESDPARARRPIYHYVFFYSPSTPPLGGGWERSSLMEAVSYYVDRFEPVVGFDIEEAKRASRVTLVGGDLQVGAALEGELKAAGCLVERVEATDANDAMRVFDELARRDQRFYYLPE